MTVQAILGVPGAGKSYEAVQWAKNAVESGRCVITNLPLKKTHPLWEKALEDGLLFLVQSTSKVAPADTDHFGHWDAWEDIGSEDRTYHRETKTGKDESSIIGPLVIVDEGMITFQEMIRNKRKNDMWEKMQVFFVAHRHMLIDIAILYQNHGQMDPAVKQVCERYHHVVNTSEMSGMNTFTVGVATKGFVNGNNYLNKRSGKFSNNVYDLYDSYAEGNGEGTMGKKAEIGVRRSRPIWMRPWFLLTAALTIIVLPIAAVKTASGIKGAITADDDGPNLRSNQIKAATATPQPVTTTLEIDPSRVQAISNPIALQLGWPDPSVPFLGFDNDNFYFPEGRRLNLFSDIQPQGFRIIEISLCRVTMVRVVETRTELLEYKCAKGY